MANGGPKLLNPVARDARKAQIAERYMRGERQYEIAATLGITQQQVSLDLKSIRADWMKRAGEQIQARKSVELARIDELERTYWDAWTKSTKQSTRTSQESRTGSGEGKRVAVCKADRDGDPRYLAGVQWCIERRCKILGLDAPVKAAATDVEGHDIINADSAREILAARIADLAQRRGETESP